MVLDDNGFNLESKTTKNVPGLIIWNILGLPAKLHPIL